MRISPHWVGGFFANFMGAFLTVGAAYLFLSGWQPIFFILPLFVIIFDIIDCVKMAKKKK